MIVRKRRSLALPLVTLALTLVPAGIAACRQNRVTAAATKPMSPADGAHDYKEQPGGPLIPPVVPTASADPGATEPEAGPPDCPPKCRGDGSWIGCGLKKPRGSGCHGCEPKCKGKGTQDEGWYDCSGVLIVARPCE